MIDRPFIISLCILASACVAALAAASRGVPEVVKTNLENLPMLIMGYRATEDRFSEEVYDVLNADKNIYRHYRSPDGKQVDLYIGYYGTAKGGRSSHNPYACFSGAGWGISESGKKHLEALPETEVNYMLTNKAGLYQVVLHWYQMDDKVISSGWKMNLDRFKGLVFRNRSDGAFIRISVNSDKQNLAEAAELAKSFAVRIVNLMPQYWPEED